MKYDKTTKRDSKMIEFFASVLTTLLVLTVVSITVYFVLSGFGHMANNVYACAGSSEEFLSEDGSSTDGSCDDGSSGYDGSDGDDGSSDGGYDGGYDGSDGDYGSSDGGYDGGYGSSDGGYDGDYGSSDGGYDGDYGSSDGGNNDGNSPISPGQLQCDLCGNDGSTTDNNSPISPGQLQCDLCGPNSDSGTGPDLTYHPDLDSPFGGLKIPEGGTPPPPTEGPSQPPVSLPPSLQWIKDHFSLDTKGLPREGQPVPEDDPSGTIIVVPCIGKGCGGELPPQPPLPVRPSP